ncbi:Inorganic pyrophosphatase 1 [Dichanthelium oligosanthes]|uniref:Inorganic pyrophosphatase 1 n=1 Tax=Dichanthelium oligosanthes TaxID=888268 RepID=A0A1E5VM24_9POAL|nr:Inorganic pyrophosphatase 1 [Dichanthelium oligosanthes]
MALLQDAMMGELHEQGKTAEDVRACLRSAPLSPHIVGAIKSAHARGCELRVLSDANAFFIDAVLAHHGLAAYFAGTDTNPAHVDAAGRLRIRPYHEFTVAAPAHGHGCALPSCPPNMCKGKVMERILQEEEAKASAARRRRRAVVYLGDGRGDYCPSLKLREGDYVMPRAGYPVCDLISAGSPPAAAVRAWAGFEDLRRVLLGIVDDEIARAVTTETEQDGAAAMNGGAVVVPADCRALPLPAHKEAALLPQAVRVPN